MWMRSWVFVAQSKEAAEKENQNILLAFLFGIVVQKWASVWVWLNYWGFIQYWLTWGIMDRSPIQHWTLCEWTAARKQATVPVRFCFWRKFWSTSSRLWSSASLESDVDRRSFVSLKSVLYLDRGANWMRIVSSSLTQLFGTDDNIQINTHNWLALHFNNHSNDKSHS